MNNFDFKKFLTENKLTTNSKLTENQLPDDTVSTEASEIDKGLRVSMGDNAEQEQKVIDIARDAIALMDEQPETSAEEALRSVLDSQD